MNENAQPLRSTSLVLAGLLGLLATGFVGVPIGIAARLFTPKYWMIWIIGSFFLSPVHQRSISNLGFDRRLAASPIAMASNQITGCVPNSDRFHERMKDTRQLELFLSQNVWNKECFHSVDFQMLEVLYLTKTGENEKALSYLDRMVKSNPNDPVIRVNLGLAQSAKLIRMGDTQAALEKVLKLKKEFPQDPNVVKMYDQLREDRYQAIKP